MAQKKVDDGCSIFCEVRNAELRPDEAALSTLVFVLETSVEDVSASLCDWHKVLFIACVEDEEAVTFGALPEPRMPGLAKC